MRLKFLGERKLEIMGLKFCPDEIWEEERPEYIKGLLLSTMFEEIKEDKKVIKKEVKEAD
jgi:hypothetical protein